MIAKILNRELYKPILEYILDKDQSTVLGFENVLNIGSSTNTLFENNLKHVGRLNETKNKYVHISLSLPEQDQLSDKNFYALATNYMQDMGYENQPYIVVKHSDTNHPHVHILTTRIQNDGKLISSSFERIKNKEVCRHLEVKHNLTLNTSFKNDKELFKYRIKEYANSDHSNKSTKEYLRDQINLTLQKYKIRSFDEFNKLLKPLGILYKVSNHQSGRKGISFSLTEDYKKFNTSSIAGNRLNNHFTFPKLNEQFESVSKSKELKGTKIKLRNQINAVLDMFESLSAKDIPEILNRFKNVDIDINISSKGDPLGFTIYDKSGYVFKSSEITKKLSLKNELFVKNNTNINLKSERVVKQIRNISKEVFQSMFLKSTERTNFKTYIQSKNLKDFIFELSNNDKFEIIWKYVNKENQERLNVFFKEIFETTKSEILNTISKNENFHFKEKIKIYNEVFNLNNNIHKKDILNSFGLTIRGNKIINLFDSKSSEDKNKITGFETLNYLIHKSIYNKANISKDKINPKAIFLPEIFPEIYNNQNQNIKEKYNKMVLKSYLDFILKKQNNIEESPKDLINALNLRGFYIERKGEAYFLKSNYTSKTSISLSKSIYNYLNNDNSLINLVKNQNLNFDTDQSLKNLYTTHLIESKNYRAAAFEIVTKNYAPLLNSTEMKFHLENGLQEEIKLLNDRKKKFIGKLSKKNNYAMKALLYEGKLYENENFNGFKDELTDFKTMKKGIND